VRNARFLVRRCVEVHVMQPSSLPVDRRARRAKTDVIDVEMLLSKGLKSFPAPGASCLRSLWARSLKGCQCDPGATQIFDSTMLMII
jgi:transposase